MSDIVSESTHCQTGQRLVGRGPLVYIERLLPI